MGKGVLCFITQHIYFSSQGCSGEGGVRVQTEFQLQVSIRAVLDLPPALLSCFIPTSFGK